MRRLFLFFFRSFLPTALIAQLFEICTTINVRTSKHEKKANKLERFSVQQRTQAVKT